MRTRFPVIAAVGAVAALLAACGTSGAVAAAGAGGAPRTIQVVAVENFWGSLASQLGGEHVQVTTIIDNPNTDPHSYEPTATDGRDIAAADLVVINGVGYDPWASQLAAASPSSNRVVLTVGDLLGVPPGGNPHRWYDPGDVHRVVDALVADYQRLDPADAAWFDQQRTIFETVSLAPYQSVVADIRRRYAGTAVGASESIVAMMTPALGLNLITPPAFLKAISEGSDPNAADQMRIETQIRTRQIKVYVFNSQNATTDIQAQISLAREAGIPVTTITETMVPATTTWQQWQTTQLQSLRAALATATGK